MNQRDTSRPVLFAPVAQTCLPVPLLPGELGHEAALLGAVALAGDRLGEE